MMQPARTAALWEGVGELIDRAASPLDLRAHGLHLLASERWRTHGRDVPAELGMQELIGIQRTVDAQEVLRRARDAYDGTIVLLKGPEIATRYPTPALRPFSDIDLLVDDAERAQRALVDAGFAPIGPAGDSYYDGLHHLRPLRLDQRLPFVEIHRRPNWIEWIDPPSTPELLETAVASSTGVDGLLALPPAHHALAIAAHSWGERPLRRMLDLLDVELLIAETDRAEVDRLAEAWGLDRLWSTTLAVADALFIGGERPWPLRLWARDLERARSRTVVEDHLRRWLSPFWALPAHRAVAATLIAVHRGLVPAPGESWSNKLARMREALTHPGRSTEAHRRALGPQGVQPWLKRRS